MKIKFIGDFKKLIPMGFTFHKLFARNYKVYEKNKVWIWVAHGGYVEIDDFYNLSGYIVKAIWEGTFPVYEKDVDYGEKLAWLNIKKGDKKPCMINRETGKIIERREFTKKYCDENGEYDYDLYREVSIYKETFEFIKELKDMNLLEIKE
jgi:hypothetical protein